MTDKEQINASHFDLQRVIRSFNTILAPNREASEVLTTLVQETLEVVNCDHLFLSRYDPASKMFRAVAWRSSINPGNVSLEQKFMGSSYLSNQPVIVNDLSQYNYRLRPAVARLALVSMVGIPFAIQPGVIGVLEAFSQNTNHFTDLDIEYLTLFAKQAAVVMEKADIARESALQAAENKFLIDALNLEQASLGSLLYKVGETFSSLFSVDGIAVFGVESEVEGSPLQEVMAQGFAMADIGRLKTLFNQEYLERLAAPLEEEGQTIIKHSLRQPGPGGAKLLYTVPIRFRRTLYGIVVFYWKQADKESELGNLEMFIKRIIDDITVILGRKHLYNSIQRISFSDTLTGLANRRLFDYVLDRELKKASRHDKSVSLLMLDIDYFKSINDTFGHQAGDLILEQLGEILKLSCRNVDLPARYGGEEFAVILPETDRDNAIAIAERVREKIAEHQFEVGKQYVSVTASIGGATYIGSKDSGPGDSLILAADQALYQAKQLGRNIVVFAGKC